MGGGEEAVKDTVAVVSRACFRSDRDPATGHEFFIGQPVNGCSGSGWIMVSTRNTCTYEAGPNPGFYYSSTGTTSNFNSG